jgi:hypothetical protein
MATQHRLNVLLKVFAELANFLFYAFFCFRLRHSVFTYLSNKALPEVSTLLSHNIQINAESGSAQSAGVVAGLPA